MADYAGAVAAIAALLKSNWTTTPVAVQNSAPPSQPWPPVDQSGNPTPWVFLEVIGNGSAPHATGIPGAQIWLYRGHVYVHVFVRTNSGADLAQQYAVTIGEIFRNKKFYDTTPPTYLRTITPQTDGGGNADDFTGWWRVTCCIDFEFYYSG